VHTPNMCTWSQSQCGFPDTAQSVQKPTFVPHDNATAVDATIDTIRAVLSLSSTVIWKAPVREGVN